MLKQWADKVAASAGQPLPADLSRRFGAGGDLEFDQRELNAARAVTVEDLLADPEVSPEQKQWLQGYAEGGVEWADQNNPPNFVTDEALWNKAKRAAAHAGADDEYAFANYWYHEHS